MFDLFQKNDVSLNDILMGEDFLHAVTDCYNSVSYTHLDVYKRQVMDQLKKSDIIIDNETLELIRVFS